jgi:hypothetical protein
MQKNSDNRATFVARTIQNREEQMRTTSLISIAISIAAISSLAFAADWRDKLPPVLRPLEPADMRVVELPGPPTVERKRIWVGVPLPENSPLPNKLVMNSLPAIPTISSSQLLSASTAKTAAARSTPPKPAPAAPGAPPQAAPAAQPAALASQPVVTAIAEKPSLPQEAVQEVAFFCQKQIGRWTAAEARSFLGKPLRSRTALDEKNQANGTIYAFRDPTSRYRELELDFDGQTGTLRTVFGYPPRLTWDDVRRRWRGDVMAADAPQGRKFYSYENRRLDVLVDAEGKVISLGLY